MLLIFLSIGSLLLAAFLGHHCSLIARGMTSYETFKWQDYRDHCMEVARGSRYALFLPYQVGVCSEKPMLQSKLTVWLLSMAA